MSEAIDYFAYNNPLLRMKTFFSLRARKKMYDRFQKICKPEVEDKVLDLGATPDDILEDSNFFEKFYPYKNRITVASIEDCSKLVEKFELERFVQNKSKEPLPFSDCEFDIVFSSAVLEHVGTRQDQEFFINECLRITKPTGKIFLTTPNRFFPLEMHTFIPFLHWLPWNWFQKVVKCLKGDFWSDINNLNLLCKKDIKKMKLLEKVEIGYIKTCGINSNLIITKG